jgi:type II secretory pathway pseudopilin PulG
MAGNPAFIGTRRFGITMVELLVAVAIVAALVALALPAVQAAREGARRTTCVNNLRNIGCSLHGHLIAKRRFPVGCTEWKASGSSSPKRCLAWSAMILPWLEEQSVADRINFSKPYNDPANAAAAATVIKLFLCPSADRAGPVVGGLGGSDYGGLNGERIRSPNKPAKGVMVNDVGYADREISDGLSKTIFVAECAREPWGDGQWINGNNLFDQAYQVNWQTWEDEMRSRHPGGAHALAGDGSVHLVAESTDSLILAAACTRALGDSAITPWGLP